VRASEHERFGAVPNSVLGEIAFDLIAGQVLHHADQHPVPSSPPDNRCPITSKGQIKEFSGRIMLFGNSARLRRDVEPRRRAAIEGELLGL
jgi:hypothetical protein